MNFYPRELPPYITCCQNCNCLTAKGILAWHWSKYAYIPLWPEKLHIYGIYHHRHKISLQIRKAKDEKTMKRRQNALGQLQETAIEISFDFHTHHSSCIEKETSHGCCSMLHSSQRWLWDPCTSKSWTPQPSQNAVRYENSHWSTPPASSPWDEIFGYLGRGWNCSRGCFKWAPVNLRDSNQRDRDSML